MLEFLDISFLSLLLILLCALLTGVLHGATGMAGGVVMASILAHIIGIKLAVPAMTCALIFSHFSRSLMYWRDTDWTVAKRVLLFGCPTIAIGAVIFGRLSPSVIALVFSIFLILSFPIKRWAKKNRIKTGPKLLAGASTVWGMLAGNVIGPGFFLAPFLLGTGMNRLAFVGTLATITLAMNTLKLSVFGITDLMNYRLLALGIIIGLVTVPGNWLGRIILKRISDNDHSTVVDALTVMMIVNFLYLALV